MSTTTYDTFLSEVLPYVHDCPQIAAINALRNAAIEFCERSRYWQVDVTAMDVVAATSSYTVPVPTGTVLVDIVESWLSGKLLIPKSAEELTRIYRRSDWRSNPGQPAYITRTMGSNILLVPVPQIAATASLALRVALAPSRASTGLDTALYERYLEIIAKGARARLYATPGQPYYDVSLSNMYHKEFMVGVGEARIQSNKGISRASVAVEYPGFA